MGFDPAAAVQLAVGPKRVLPSINLTFRPLDRGDVAGIFPIWSDPAVVKFTNWPLISSIEECAARVDRILGRYKAGSFRIGPFCIVGDDEEILGIAGCDVNESFDGEHELWYLFRRDAWGKGMGSRSVVSLMNAVRSIPGVTKVVATAVAPNVASWKILEKCGFRQTGTFAGGFERAGVIF